jgi:3-hydroxyisobutyrate dehydrogenase-like beta-hydroxyacid dehydrogenase
MNPSIAFIGLGNMGYPIARNLIEQGFFVSLYNRTPEKLRDLVSLGGHAAETPGAAVAAAAVVMTMLSDDAAVTAVVDQVLPSLQPGTVFLSLSTIKAETAQMLAERCRTRDVQYVASPVMGRPPAAAARQLSILLSGDAGAKALVAPIVAAIGLRSFDFGAEPGTAHTVKVMLNFMVFAVVEMLSEVMLMAEKAGIDKAVLLDTMLNTIYGAPVFKNYGTLIVQEGDVPNGFAAALANKDLRLAQETAAALGAKLPLAELVKVHFEEMIAEGKGEKDVSGLITHLRRSR